MEVLVEVVGSQNRSRGGLGATGEDLGLLPG